MPVVRPARHSLTSRRPCWQQFGWAMSAKTSVSNTDRSAQKTCWFSILLRSHVTTHLGPCEVEVVPVLTGPFGVLTNSASREQGAMAVDNERILPSDLLAVAVGSAPFLLGFPVLAAAGTYMILASVPPTFRAQASIQGTVVIPEGSATFLRHTAEGESESIIAVEAQSADTATTILRTELTRLNSEPHAELTSATAAIDREISIYQDLYRKIVQQLDHDIQSQGSITESIDAIIRLNTLLRSLEEEKRSVETAEKAAGNVAQKAAISVERISPSPVRATVMAAVAGFVLAYVLSFALWRWRIFAATPASVERFKSTQRASSLLGRFARK